MVRQKLATMAQSDDEVIAETRRNYKPFWSARYFDGLYHVPCDDGSAFGEGQMSYTDGVYACACGHSVDY